MINGVPKYRVEHDELVAALRAARRAEMKPARVPLPPRNAQGARGKGSTPGSRRMLDPQLSTSRRPFGRR
jgi:hypothetical protein